MAGQTAKYTTTEDVLLFKKAESGAASIMRVPEGTAVETDGVKVFWQGPSKDTQEFYKCKVGGKTGYILAFYVAQEA